METTADVVEVRFMIARRNPAVIILKDVCVDAHGKLVT
jgi:hypothetical protein